MSEETYNKCIKPEGEFKGKRVGPKDIIHLQGGGTGYAGRDGEKAQVKKHFALGECLFGVWVRYLPCTTSAIEFATTAAGPKCWPCGSCPHAHCTDALVHMMGLGPCGCVPTMHTPTQLAVPGPLD